MRSHCTFFAVLFTRSIPLTDEKMDRLSEGSNLVVKNNKHDIPRYMVIKDSKKYSDRSMEVKLPAFARKLRQTDRPTDRQTGS